MIVPALLLLLPSLAIQEERPLVTQDELLEIVRDAMPLVERATGRKFRDPVWTRVSTRADVERALADELVPQMRLLAPQADADQARLMADQTASAYGGILIAKYAWKTGTVHVVPETIRSIAAAAEQPRLLDRSVLRVIVTHELVHALDSQDFGLFRRLDEVKTAAELEIRNALSEGHAQHVARRVFEAGGELSEFEAYEKAILAGPPSLGEAEKYLASVMTTSLRLAYVDGRAFFDALQKLAPKTYVEDVFRSPPSRKNVILRPERFYSKDAAAEFDPAPAFDAFAREFGDDWSRRTQELDHGALRASFGDFVDAAEVEAALKGIDQGHALVLTPKAAPQSKIVIASILRATDAAAARKMLDASMRLAKAKDARFTKEPIKITKAAYGKLALSGNIEHVLWRKTIEVQGQVVTVTGLAGCAGDTMFDVILSNEAADDARVKAMVERLLEALPKK